MYYCNAVEPLFGFEQVDTCFAHWVVGPPKESELRRFHGMVASPNFPLSAERLRSMAELRVVSAYGVGYDYIDVAVASELGILVTNTPDAVTNATAELGLTLVLAVCRNVLGHDAQMRRTHRPGQPNPTFAQARMTHDFSSQTVGIIGYGRIGQRLGRLLEAIGFATLYTRKHGPLEGHRGYRDMDDLLAESDVVVVATPLTSDTFHLIDQIALRRMKPEAALVNIGRGACVDESALIEALDAGRLAGAALDVFEHEPRVSERLVALPQVILSPHVGTLTQETRMLMTRQAIDNVKAGLEGRAQNAVNAAAWTRNRR
ncbi:NAD(P)-dependent oxidoreductase [Sulfobacillus harzensis]|uniref:Uncharacterized protein n=1 Tax=Sulfobacillus harzensis TaxID=2729629 RepID=A0A7Y0L1L7_9FIRM|nr:hypothetical protein [Sulfobacillus harzensis]